MNGTERRIREAAAGNLTATKSIEWAASGLSVPFPPETWGRVIEVITQNTVRWDCERGSFHYDKDGDGWRWKHASGQEMRFVVYAVTGVILL